MPRRREVLRREEHDEENQPEDVAATLLRRALRVEGAGVRDEHPRRGVGVGFGRRRRRVARGSGSIQLEGRWASERADEICRRTRPRAPRELQFDANAFEFCSASSSSFDRRARQCATRAREPMTKFDNVRISSRGGKRVADDHGVNWNEQLPSTGFEVDADGWLKPAKPDPGATTGRDARERRASAFVDFHRADDDDADDGDGGDDAGALFATLVIELYDDLAPLASRAFADACARASTRGDASVRCDGIDTLHVSVPRGDDDASLAALAASLASSSESPHRIGRAGGGSPLSHAAGAGTISLDSRDGSFALLFAPMPEWDRRGAQRVVVGRIRRGCERDVDALRRAAAAASIRDDADGVVALRVGAAGRVVDDVGGGVFGTGDAAIASSRARALETAEEARRRRETKGETAARVEAESDQVKSAVRESLAYAAAGAKRKARSIHWFPYDPAGVVNAVP